MNEKILKICRVEDVNSAKMLIWQNVDLLGMHLIKKDDMDRVYALKEIVDELKKTQSFNGSVLVTRIKDLTILKSVLIKCNFDYLQMHISLSFGEIDAISNLTKELGVDLILVHDPKVVTEIEALKKQAKFIIIDNIEGGTGFEVDEKLINLNIDSNKVLLGGGITSSNVLHKLFMFNPKGFDVQSFTEYPDKSKNFNNVDRLIKLLKKGSYRLNIKPDVKIISISLTDLNYKDFEKKIKPIYNLFDCFHVDHASGWVSSKFVRDSKEIVYRLNALAPSKPYDLHLFVEPNDLLKTIDDYLELNFRMHIAYIHVEDIELFNEESLLLLKKEFLNRRIKLGFALQTGAISIKQVNIFLPLLKKLEISEISIVGLSNRSAIDKYKEMVQPLASEISKININLNDFFNIALDRETTPEKLSLVVRFGISKVFSGKSILESPEPLFVIEQFRNLLYGSEI